MFGIAEVFRRSVFATMRLDPLAREPRILRVRF